jgi:hypothetical protein
VLHPAGQRGAEEEEEEEEGFCSPSPKLAVVLRVHGLVRSSKAPRLRQPARVAICSDFAQGTQETQRSPNPNLEEAQRSPNPSPEHVGHCPKQMPFSSLRVNVVTFYYCGLLLGETKLAFLLTLSIGSQTRVYKVGVDSHK